jgi:hypothetical protein
MGQCQDLSHAQLKSVGWIAKYGHQTIHDAKEVVPANALTAIESGWRQTAKVFTQLLLQASRKRNELILVVNKRPAFVLHR